MSIANIAPCECDDCAAFYARHTTVNADGETERPTFTRACRTPEATFPLVRRNNTVRWDRLRRGVDACVRDEVRYLARELFVDVWNPDAAWSAGMSGTFCTIVFREPPDSRFDDIMNMDALHESDPEAFARWARTWQRLRTKETA